MVAEMAQGRGREGMITIPYGFYTDRRLAARAARNRKAADMAIIEPKMQGPHEHDCWIKKPHGWAYYWRGEFMRKATPEEAHLMNSLGPMYEPEPEPHVKLARQALELAQTYNTGSESAMRLLIAARDFILKAASLGVQNVNISIGGDC